MCFCCLVPVDGESVVVPVLQVHWEITASPVKYTPDVSKPFEKADIIGPTLAASTYEVVFICNPAGLSLIHSATTFSLSLFFLSNFCIFVNT